MKAFAQLIVQLDQTNKTNAKVQHLADYFEVAKDEDKVWVIALFTGRRLRRAIKTTLLREWASELTDIPLWLVEESYHIVGDLAETLSLVLPPLVETDREEKSLAEWMRFLKRLKDMDDEEATGIIAAGLESANGPGAVCFQQAHDGRLSAGGLAKAHDPRSGQTDRSG